MDRVDYTPPDAELDRPPPGSGEVPLMHSDDQQFYEESLRASVRTLGRLVQKRRKTGKQN